MRRIPSERTCDQCKEPLRPAETVSISLALPQDVCRRLYVGHRECILRLLSHGSSAEEDMTLAEVYQIMGW